MQQFVRPSHATGPGTSVYLGAGFRAVQYSGAHVAAVDESLRTFTLPATGRTVTLPATGRSFGG